MSIGTVQMAPTVNGSSGANEPGSNQGTMQTALATQNAPGKFSGVTGTEKPATAPEVAKTVEEVKALDFAKKFSQLSKKEAALRAREAEMASKYKPVEEELGQYKELKTLKDNAKNNPMAVLRALGLTYDDVVNFQLRGGESAPELHYKELERKFEDSRKEIEQRLLSEKQKEAEAHKTQAIDSYKQNIHKFINENSNDYELINFKNAKDTVFETIEAHYNKYGVELSLKEAFDAVEIHFESEDLEKMASLNKMKSRFAPPAEPKKVSPFSQSVRTPSVTLNSKIGAELKSDVGSLSRDERMKLAVETLKAGRGS